MIELEQILSRCTEEQLESMLDSSLTMMKHIEFVTGHTATYLAGESEHFWKLYTLNAMSFEELAARAQGKRKRNPAPLG